MINGAPFGAVSPTYGGSMPADAKRRRLVYLVLMGTCVTLFLLAGLVVRRFSAPLAVVMALVALAIPPLAAIFANAGRER
jgi:hypothetical protein